MARAESRAMSLMRGLNVAPPGVAPVTSASRVGLMASEPANGATEPRSPAALALEFSGPVRLTALVVANRCGTRVETGFSIGLLPDAVHRIALPSLKPGAYTVLWRARPADRLPIGGTIAFTVAGD
jgi:copper resistance protein C